MTLMKRMKSLVLIGVLSVALFGLVGCGGVTEEQYAQLDALKKEVAALQNEANSLKDERSRLEKEIAEKNKKLEECNKLKQETRANLDKIKK